MSASGKLYFVSVEIMANKEGIDLPRFMSKIDGLLEDYSSATHVIYKFKVSESPASDPTTPIQHFTHAAMTRVTVSKVMRIDNCDKLILFTSSVKQFGNLITN